jgi:hypothetical protein
MPINKPPFQAFGHPCSIPGLGRASWFLLFSKTRFIIDSHTDALQASFSTGDSV